MIHKIKQLCNLNFFLYVIEIIVIIANVLGMYTLMKIINTLKWL